MKEKVLLGQLIGLSLDEEFINFDLTEIQDVLSKLSGADSIDLPHAELLQQQSLRGADILCEYLAKITKTVSYLESRVSSVKNKTSLEYQSADGGKTTSEMKKWAGECSVEVENLLIKLASAKGSKILLEKKYDILIKSHHHYKDISAGLRKTILGYNPLATSSQTPEGWD